MVETVLQNQTFIGMGMRVGPDVIGVENAQRAKITKIGSQKGEKMGR